MLLSRLLDYPQIFLLAQTRRTDESSISSGPKYRQNALVET
jgi:hypothetical protein